MSFIIHMDADNFFASCEQSRNPKYKGKPVIVGGADRGIGVAASLEAKKLGISRGIPRWEVQKIAKDAVILPVDMRLYGLYSKSMFSIVERYVDVLEKYSIDECFAVLKISDSQKAEEIAYKIKEEIKKKLDITVSVGVSTTKVLAKVASKRNKPDGVCLLLPKTQKEKEIFSDTTIGKIWGIGGQTAAKLNQADLSPHYGLGSDRQANKGIVTVKDFVDLPADYVLKNFDKHLREIYQELKGVSVMTVNDKESLHKSIQKTRTFKPVSGDVRVVLTQLSKNIERAFWKARGMNVAPREIHLFLKTKEFRYKRKTLSFPESVVNQSVIMREAEKFCIENIKKGELYRSTGITLSSLYPINLQTNLFTGSKENSRLLSMYKAIDDLALKYGKGMVAFGTSFIPQTGERKTQQSIKIISHNLQIPRLGLPFLGIVR